MDYWPRAHLNKFSCRFSSRIIQYFETLANNHVEQENFTNAMIVERDVAFVGTRVRQCVCIRMLSYSLDVDNKES